MTKRIIWATTSAALWALALAMMWSGVANIIADQAQPLGEPQHVQAPVVPVLTVLRWKWAQARYYRQALERAQQELPERSRCTCGCAYYQSDMGKALPGTIPAVLCERWGLAPQTSADHPRR